MVTKTIATKRFIGCDVPDEIALPLVLSRIMERRHFAESGCHEYTGYIDPYGYGDLVFKKRNWKVHRLLWVCLHGPIPEWPEAVVMHSCDNRKCINPEHLSVSTQQDNIRDCVHKVRQASRRKTHCPQGHEYAQTAIFISYPSHKQQATPWRICRECQKGWNHRNWLKRKAKRASQSAKDSQHE